MITCNETIYQWDVSRTVDVDTDCEVHFALKGEPQALVVASTLGRAYIPNILLQDGRDIIAWEVQEDKTLETKRIAVMRRAKPADYVYTETETITFETLVAEVREAVAKALEQAERAEQAVSTIEKTNADIQQAETKRAEEFEAMGAKTDAGIAKMNKAESDVRQAEEQRVAQELSRTQAEAKREESFTSNLTSWNQKVDAEVAKTSQAITETNKAKDNAITATNKANEAIAQLPLPTGNVLKGEARGVIAHADDVYPSKALGLTVYGASSQDGTPSPDAPKPISSVTKADMSVCGKNLFGRFETRTVNGVTFSQESDGTVVVKGTPTKPYTNMRYSLDRSVFGQAVTVTCAGNVGNGASDAGAVYPQITIENAMGANTNAGLYANMEKLTMDIPSDARGASIIISCGEDTTQARDARLKVIASIGRSAEDYEPHTSASIPINLQGHELCSLPNGVRDEVRIDKDGNIELVKRTWTLRKQIGDMNNAENYPGWVIPFSEMTCPLESGYDAQITGFSTHFHRFYGRYIKSQTEWLIYTMNVGATQSELITQYPNEVVIFIGELHEPIITSLGKVDMPTLPAPVCNVWANDENPTDVKFSYIRDVNIAYEKLASALANAMNTPITIPELEL